MNEYTVYLHISPNGKRYYGITIQDVKKRWNSGYGYPNNKYFTNAIKKYGWNNFEHIIVVKGLNEEEAKWLEIELIKEWDTTDRDKGYNITKGGESANGWHPSEETIKKMRQNHADFRGENNPNYGKHFSEEHRKKLSENHADVSGKNHPRAKSVICLTTKRIFHTAKEGSKYYGAGHVVECCQGKLKSAGKYNGEKLVWRYLNWNHNKTYRINK